MTPRSARPLVWLLVVSLLAIGVYWAFDSRLLTPESVRRSITGMIAGGDRPPAGADAEPRRILPDVRPPGEFGEYRFLTMSGGKPVRYSPCRRLSVVVNPRGAPPDALATVSAAVAEISAATGLSLTVSGTTRERYSSQRRPYQPRRYGDRWAPILVSFAGAGSVPEFDGDAVGFGGSLSLDPVVGDPSYVTGSVVLDRDFFADPANQGYLNEAVLHEFGHVMGLDHVSDGAQIMWSGGLHGSGLGSGDRAGLARLGRGPCTPDL